MENQNIPNPTPEPIITSNQVEVVENKSKSSPVLLIALVLLLLLSLASTAFLYYQNMQLRSMLSGYQIPIASSTPTATTDPTADWKIYTSKNSTFSFKYPSNWFLWNSADGDSLLLDESPFDPNLIAEPDQVEITFTTTARDPQSAKALLTKLGMPFAKAEEVK